MESKGKFEGLLASINLTQGSYKTLVTFEVNRAQAAELLKLDPQLWLTFEWGPYESKKDKAA